MQKSNKSVNGIELKEGQIWYTRAGHLVKIYKSEDPAFPWAGVNEFSKERICYRANGRWHGNPKFDTGRDLIKLVKDVPMKENKQFNPKPGDKIICNNGEEFICCTLGFLQEKISHSLYSSKSILGYDEDCNEWQDWYDNGCAYLDKDSYYNIREVIPAESNEVVKEEEPRYTVEEVTEAFENALHYCYLGGRLEGINKIKDYLSKKNNAEYQEYLRLKAIYE